MDKLDTCMICEEPFKEGDYGWALPGTQLHELRNIADMTQTERAKAKELANLKNSEKMTPKPQKTKHFKKFDFPKPV